MLTIIIKNINKHKTVTYLLETVKHLLETVTHQRQSTTYFC